MNETRCPNGRRLHVSKQEQSASEGIGESHRLGWVSPSQHYWHWGPGDSLLGGCVGYCRVLSSTPGLYSLGASSTLFPVVTMKNVSRQCDVSLGGGSEGENHSS